MRIRVHAYALQRHSQLQDINLVPAIFIEVLMHLDHTWVILQDAHRLHLLLDFLLFDSCVVRRFLAELENVINALNLLLVLPKELKEALQEA